MSLLISYSKCLWCFRFSFSFKGVSLVSAVFPENEVNTEACESEIHGEMQSGGQTRRRTDGHTEGMVDFSFLLVLNDQNLHWNSGTCTAG